MKRICTLLIIGGLLFNAANAKAQEGINISNGYHVIVHADTYLGMEGDLKVSTTEGLIIKPKAAVTTKGDLTLASERKGIVVQTSTASGTPRGSYIVLGNVSHSGKGSMEVQSYITGLAGADTVSYMHFVGAPLEDTTSGYNNSVRLQQFDMTHLDTYAYYWDSSVDTNNASPWVNIWPYDYEVPLGVGLTLTNGVAGSDTIIMEGYPVDNDITYTVTYSSGNGLALISNPFPSAIDFSQFASDNSSYIENKYWIWQASGDNAGNYYPNSNGTGGSQYIQLGQAFFVQIKTNANGNNINFTNNEKVHNDVAFRETNPYELSMHVSGGMLGFGDNIWIRFMEGASAGLDDFDALKWNSINNQATMIRTIARDGSQLAINMLPPELMTIPTSVPVKFDCGENAEYTFTFKGFDSFNQETEIWLEDDPDGSGFNSEWVPVDREGLQYVFTSAPGSYPDRFKIHFFGPTFVPEEGTTGDGNHSVKIYGYGNEAYVLNNTNENIKNVSIYNLMGQVVFNGEVPQQTMNKIYVADKTGYYVVRVTTDKEIYTEKILITK